MDDIILLQPDQRVNTALMVALDAAHRLRLVGDLAELEDLMQRATPRACILDIFESLPPEPLTALRHLRHRYPTIALVIASDFGGREMDLYHLGRLNVDGVIRMEEGPSSREIVAVVDAAIAASLATRVLLGAARDLPPLAREAMRWAIEHAETRPQVSELAAALAMSPRVLLREMKAQKLASPRAFLLWGRLIRASHLLERASVTVESAAFHLGYATGGALGKALKKHVGYSPTSLLERGGLAWTLDVFQRRCVRPAEPVEARWAKPGS